jgi:hypothetical protein
MTPNVPFNSFMIKELFRVWVLTSNLDYCFKMTFRNQARCCVLNIGIRLGDVGECLYTLQVVKELDKVYLGKFLCYRMCQVLFFFFFWLFVLGKYKVIMKLFPSSSLCVFFPFVYTEISS